MLFKPLLDRNQLLDKAAVLRAARVAAVGAGLLVALAACDLPFDLGQPTTRALENGAAQTLTEAKTFALRGTYSAPSGEHWVLAVTVVRPDREEISITGPSEQLDAILIGSQGYFSGQAFLAKHMGTDSASQNLVRAAGSAWWKGTTDLAPQLPNLLGGDGFRATFLGPAVTQRKDRVDYGGVPAVELSGPRADVYIRAAEPYYVLGLVMRKGVVIDGLGEAALNYSNFNRSYQISPPGDVIDFSNLTTLPPIYTVVSVDTTGCGSPCVVSALLKNLGGLHGAKGPSTVTFVLAASVSGTNIGNCQAQVTPDVAYNATTRVSCTMSLSRQPDNAAVVTATVDNPGHA